jgi:hypothetical protein
MKINIVTMELNKEHEDKYKLLITRHSCDRQVHLNCAGERFVDPAWTTVALWYLLTGSDARFPERGIIWDSLRVVTW